MSDYYQFRDETGTPIDYYQLVDDNNELCKEIKRLKEQLNDEIDDGLKQSEIMLKQHNEIERLNNIIKEVGEILNNKRDKMIMQQFDCDFEELLYQIDEEIREVIKSE